MTISRRAALGTRIRLGLALVLVLAVGACVTPDGSPTQAPEDGAPSTGKPAEGEGPGSGSLGPAPGIPKDGPGPAPGIPGSDGSTTGAAPPLPGQNPNGPVARPSDEPDEEVRYKVKTPVHGKECFDFCEVLCPAMHRCDLVEMSESECVAECRKACPEDKISKAYEKCLDRRCKKMAQCLGEVDEEQHIVLPSPPKAIESDESPGTGSEAASPTTPAPTDKAADAEKATGE
ncbi:hypothetical protein KDL45_14220 [bacterium]|nr:hypothetical protein [bacterium]